MWHETKRIESERQNQNTIQSLAFEPHFLEHCNKPLQINPKTEPWTADPEPSTLSPEP